MQFRIDRIKTERRPNGKSIITATCIEDSTEIEIEVQNYILASKDSLKIVLECAYKERSIKVGDIL